MNIIRNMFSAAAHLFYPHLCLGCGSDILSKNKLICIRCFDALPYTGFESIPQNPIEKIFYGRIPLVTAHSGFYFNKGELIQHLVHELKYKGNRPAGIYLAALMGDKMLESGRFNDIDHLVPLPLAAEKEFRRGFNQAEVICTGLSASLNIPVSVKNVIRSRYTETQTKKHRAERWDNVSGSFTLNDPAAFYNKHILLVDDVITTGATLEACASAILAAGNIRISIATLAVASK